MRTYAMYRNPNVGLYPRYDEPIVLEKTDSKVKVAEYMNARRHERVAWKDIDGELYVMWFGEMRHIENHLWGYGIDQTRSPLKDENMTWRR